jgi:hypothetical protein
MIPRTEIMQCVKRECWHSCRECDSRNLSPLFHEDLRRFVGEEEPASCFSGHQFNFLTWRLRKALRTGTTPHPVVSTDSGRAVQQGNIETALWARGLVDLVEPAGRGKDCTLCFLSYYLIYLKCSSLDPSEMHPQPLTCHASPPQSLVQPRANYTDRATSACQRS